MPDAWDEVMRTMTPQGAALPTDELPRYHFGTPPLLMVDAACPRCHRADLWKLWQTLGATPGLPGAPATRGGVVYRCGRCGIEVKYREPALAEHEVAAFTARLLRGPPAQ